MVHLNPPCRRCAVVSTTARCVAVWTQPDRPPAAQQVARPSGKNRLERALTILQPTKKRLKEQKPSSHLTGADVAVVVAYGRILPTNSQRAPPRCVNVHSRSCQSIVVPRRSTGHRQRELQTGVTTMQIVPELDAVQFSET